MTLLPMESWNIKARPDLPEYELNAVDARPGSDRPATENHHIWRRSFGAGFPEAWWVELEDGTVVPARVGLSSYSHEKITTGKAQIVAIQFARLERPVFYWLDEAEIYDIAAAGENPYFVADKYGKPLQPQPGSQAVDMQLTVEGEEEPHDSVVGAVHTHAAGSVPEGSTCPTCERRVPKKKTDASPITKVCAYRVPVDDVETHKDILAATSEHMGLGTNLAHWQWQTITGMCAIILQLPAADVRVKSAS
jgi:hypothetical protein